MKILSFEPREHQVFVIPLLSNDHLEQHLLHLLDADTTNDLWPVHAFKANSGEVLPLSLSGRRALLLGIGKEPHFSAFLKAFRLLTAKSSELLTEEVVIDLQRTNVRSSDHYVLAEAAGNGLALGTYRIGKYRSEAGEPPRQIHSLSFRGGQPDLVRKAERGMTVADTQTHILDLVNAPSNHKHPAHIADYITGAAARYGFQANVLDKPAIEALGLEALLAVNRGSSEPPFFAILEYRSPKKADRTIGLVGKGVTFDTGGLSIKSSANMHYMKSDMGGAGAVIGTVEIAARLQLPVHLIGIIPLTDNSVDALSTKPSDVIGSYSGKTIEVIDTDAEGRLILADALSYLVRNYHVDAVIDLATLTGSAVRALGYQAAALFSKNDRLAQALTEAGEVTGERVWRLPLWDSYGEELQSDIADLRNLGVKPVAGAIVAAKFLEQFTDQHPSWAHLDIAGTAFGDSPFSAQKSATAFGIRLLLEYLEQAVD